METLFDTKTPPEDTDGRNLDGIQEMPCMHYYDTTPDKVQQNLPVDPKVVIRQMRATLVEQAKSRRDI